MTLDPTLIQSGLFLGLIGTIVASLRSIPGRVFALVKARVYLECTIDSEDSLYYWMTIWLSSRQEIQRTGSLRIVSKWEGNAKAISGSGGGSAGVPEVSRRVVSLAPGDGDHVLRYQGARFWLSSTSDPPSGFNGARLRTLRIKTWMRHRPRLEAMLTEIAALEQTPEANVTNIMVADGFGWRLATQRRRRLLESVVLSGDTMDGLLREAHAFFDSADEYARLGIPHRWGLLLDGPPGNGKSTLALALAGEFRSSLYVLSLGDPLMTDDKLASLMAAVPDGSIVVAEDVDAIFEGRQRQADNKLTFSGLLNAIDGPVASEGRILVLTSNRPEVLDAALIRPGRVDRRITLGNATADQARTMWRRFSRPVDGEESFTRWATEGDRSMAVVQQRLVEEREVVSL